MAAIKCGCGCGEVVTAEQVAIAKSRGRLNPPYYVSPQHRNRAKNQRAKERAKKGK